MALWVKRAMNASWPQIQEQALVDVLLPKGLVHGGGVPILLGLGKLLKGHHVHIARGKPGLHHLVVLGLRRVGDLQGVAGIGLMKGFGQSPEKVHGGRVGPGEQLHAALGRLSAVLRRLRSSRNAALVAGAAGQGQDQQRQQAA